MKNDVCKHRNSTTSVGMGMYIVDNHAFLLQASVTLGLEVSRKE